MKGNIKIKNVFSLVLLTVFLSGVVNASEEDYGEDIYRGSVVHQGNISLSNNTFGEVDTFTYNSEKYRPVTPHKVVMKIGNEIPANTIFWDPLYYSTNK